MAHGKQTPRRQTRPSGTSTGTKSKGSKPTLDIQIPPTPDGARAQPSPPPLPRSPLVDISPLGSPNMNIQTTGRSPRKTPSEPLTPESPIFTRSNPPSEASASSATIRTQQNPPPWPLPSQSSPSSSSNNRTTSSQPRRKKHEPTIPTIPESPSAKSDPQNPNQNQNPRWSTDASTTLHTPTAPRALSDIGSTTTAQQPAMLDAPNMKAVSELLQEMKHTLSNFGTTFISLGEDTAKVAEMGPAMEALKQIESIKASLKAQSEQQQQRINEAQGLVRKMVNLQVTTHLQGLAKETIKERVQQEVRAKVQEQLTIQIPKALRQQVQTHDREILEIQAHLYNSEAKRHNATIPNNALRERLRPLLRPLPTPDQSPIRLATATISPTLERPSKSPLFPRDLKSLFDLGEEDARTLVQHYGLQSPSSPVPPSATYLRPILVGATPIESRERNLNLFMEHIGVPFEIYMVASPDGHGPPSPMITSAAR